MLSQGKAIFSKTYEKSILKFISVNLKQTHVRLFLNRAKLCHDFYFLFAYCHLALCNSHKNLYKVTFIFKQLLFHLFYLTASSEMSREVNSLFSNASKLIIRSVALIFRFLVFPFVLLSEFLLKILKLTLFFYTYEKNINQAFM